MSTKSLPYAFRHLMRLLRSVYVGSLPTSYSGFRAFRCLESQKQHKPWQFERTRVNGASLQQWSVCHPNRFRVRFIISCDFCARSHVGSLRTSY